jgi:hypothetical protein
MCQPVDMYQLVQLLTKQPTNRSLFCGRRPDRFDKEMAKGKATGKKSARFERGKKWADGSSAASDCRSVCVSAISLSF